MNMSSPMDFTDQDQADLPRRTYITQDAPPVAVQILSVIAFGVVSIVGVAVAFDANWIAGLIVTAVIVATWARSRTFGGKGFAKASHKPSVEQVAPAVPAQRTSGNASFDAYRQETLARLEQESADFDNFLTRLRDARDASEFDQFMDDRAKIARQTAPQIG